MNQQSIEDEKLKRLRERTLRILARSGRAEALHSLHGYLHQMGRTGDIERGHERAAAGDLETEAGVRSYINSIV